MATLLSCSVTAFAADYALQIESKIPTTISGTLGYASLKYWIAVPGKGNVELLTDADNEGGLIELVGKQVSLNGAMYWSSKARVSRIGSTDTKTTASCRCPGIPANSFLILSIKFKAVGHSSGHCV